MEYLDKIVQESLDRYFTVLEKTGYVKEEDVDRLQFLIYLQEFLNEYQYYITEEDYNIIDNIVNCLAGRSCLIPYREYMELSRPLMGYVYNIPIKITEVPLESKIRHTEVEEALRLVNQ